MTDPTPPKGRVPAAIAQKYPDLEALILETESMTPEERDYWFQILPIMTDEQVQKLRGILINEKEQLTKLDAQYEEELSKLNDKHLLEWKEHESKARREEIQKQEAVQSTEDTQKQDALLEQLDELGGEDTLPKAA